MKAMEFIDSVVPRGGTYCIVGIKDKKVIQKFAPTLNDAQTIIKEGLSNQLNMYFALGSFKDGSARTQKNVSELKAFFLDIDCGEDKAADGKGYVEKSVALSAVREFLDDTGMPHPTIIDSGGGWHMYWALDTAISRDKWYPIANKFKQLCMKKGLLIDPAVPADSARVLRIPNTINYKRDAKVKFLEGVAIAPPISLTQFETPLREAAASMGIVESSVPEFLRGAVRELDETTKALLGSRITKFSVIAQKSVRGEGCAQVKYCLANAATLDEPRWRAVLSIAQACDDRDTAIHKISSKHPGYSPDATEKKALETEGPYKGPYKCTTFESSWPTECAGCKFKGTITNPIVLATVFNAADGNEVVIPVTEPVSEAFVAPAPLTIKFPKLPYPYERGAKGGIYKHNKQPDGSETVDLVYINDLFVMKRVFDALEGEVVLINLLLPMDGLIEFVIPVKYIGSTDRLRDVLGHHGISAQKKKMEEIMSYIITAANEVQQSVKREQARSQFGWFDADDTFVIGKREISEKGVKASTPSSNTVNLAPYMEPKGSYEEWKTVMNVFSRPNWETHQLGALIAFGAPLMKYSGENGLTVNFVSEHSGTGKTLIQHFINSVYGQTDRVMLRKADTIASRYHRFGVMCHLPICMDEITNINPFDLSDLVYAFSEGRGKERMEAGANRVRVNETWWASICACSSNSNMADKLTANKSTADAELMRIFEFNVEKPEELDPDYAQGLKIILEHNYGIAGDIYLKAIMSDRKGAVSLFNDVRKEVNRRLGSRSKERMWVAGFTAMITGGYIAKKVGIIDWDIDHLFDLLIEKALVKRSEVDDEALDYNSVLGEFLGENKGAILQINGEDDARSGLPSAPIYNPNLRIVGRYEPDTGLLYVVRSIFKEYCVKKQIPYTTTIANIKGDISLVSNDKKVRLMKGTGIVTPPIYTLLFKGKFGELEHEHDETAS